MEHVAFFGLLVFLSVVFALLEIQIEGSDGWARTLPTWRFQNRFTERLIGARAITGYHLYIHLFVLGIAHLGFAIAPGSWSWPLELRVIAFLVLFWVLEDFLWFVFNPAYGLRRFRPEHVWWHAPNWWGPMPRDYWIFLPLGAGLYLAAV